MKTKEKNINKLYTFLKSGIFYNQSVSKSIKGDKPQSRPSKGV